MSSSADNKTCIIIAGPTAVGKTSASLAVAEHFHTSIISADSRQCYREMNIGVAKPSAAELDQVKHYFINSHSVSDDVNAGVFETYALAAIDEVFASSDIAVMVGGTGLYIKAFTDGMDAIPAAPQDLRNQIIYNYQQLGLPWLQEQIKEKDPAWFAEGELQNPQRIMRALEVVMHTGQSILGYRNNEKQKRPFRIIKTALTLPREQLYQRINDRVDDMIAAGLEDEVKSLMPFRSLNALQTVGYTEMFEYLDGRITRDRAIDLIKQNSRHYAKRQLTWFGRDVDTKWFDSLDYSQLISGLINLV